MGEGGGENYPVANFLDHYGEGRGEKRGKKDQGGSDTREGTQIMERKGEKVSLKLSLSARQIGRRVM